MSVIDDYKKLMLEVRSGTFKPVYLLHGEESFFIDRIADEVEHLALADHERDFNQTILYGRDANHETVKDTCLRFPMMAERQLVAPGASRDDLRGLLRVYKANVQAVLRYRPAPIHADITAVVSAELAGRAPDDPSVGWQALTSGRVTVHTVDGTHLSILKLPAVAQVAEILASDVPV